MGTDRASLSQQADEAWRDPAQVVSHWEEAGRVDPRLLEYEVEGEFWELLASHGLTLLVSREYEHLLVGLSASSSGPQVSFLSLPHPSGVAVDFERGKVYVAATRNPNQIFELSPLTGSLARLDAEGESHPGRPLLPTSTRFYPGCLYLHDLALIGGALYGNAVGQNAVVRLSDSRHERVWWPKCIEGPNGPVFGQNHLQLNSIAAADDLESSFFTASCDELGELRPGQPEFPVDGRGVIFSGETREPVVRGLTRPHSARLHAERLWLANSGYGEVGYAESERLVVTAKLPGWTRGLCFHDQVAFVGVSRVLPRFQQYAPGLELETSRCGVYALDTLSGKILGSIRWPSGNQIFAVQAVPRSLSHGFPFFAANTSSKEKLKRLFYAFRTQAQEDE